ncbi:hypothetical protein SAMN05444000_13418 [Shimia gijangensis]|uniref:Uncharacterized protein n=1 Tax=Shimia gijangensis TaxID=1470563 RepID=A0A1M6T2F2_9RHOB|nr:hypothetical protein [Shimia gijangensis]SHK51144.1 hypothetical protein SAMN05444000_13418 [Shimia gijangensis]
MAARLHIWTTLALSLLIGSPAVAQENLCDPEDDGEVSQSDQKEICVEEGTSSQAGDSENNGIGVGSLCGKQVTSRDISGDYTLTVGSAVMTGGGKVIPLNVQSTSQVKIFEAESELMMGDGVNNVALKFTDADDWDLEASPIMSDVSGPGFAAAVGCNSSELPHLIGKGKTATVEFVYYLIVESVSAQKFQLFGLVEWNGGGINQKRGVVLSPN